MKKSSNSIPKIKRSRGYLLYDTQGKRYLDLFLDNGRAILGHRLDGISGVIKSTVSKGLTAAYPSIYENRLEKQLRQLFPFVREFLVFGNMERAVSALFSGKKMGSREAAFVDFPSLTDKYGVWRPFWDNTLDWSRFKYFIPVLPSIGSFGPVVICSNTDEAVTGSDLLSPMFYDILIKSVVSLRRSLDENNPGQKDFFDSPVWTREGIYLRFNIGGTEYSALFEEALKCGILLPPEEDIPGIIPLRFESGQIKAFRKMIRSEYGS
ncbi:MAG: hypothetical protein L3J12_02905 [Spirochaetales bacterium]|nr:hypothetical protein [Spirochaetales bacterium]